MKYLLLSLSVILGGIGVADADTITAKGKSYSDVLVYESGGYYFVKLPREGRAFSVRTSEVASDKVKIVDDPVYRDQLRALYDDVKLRGAAALKDAKPINSAFVDAPPAARVIDTSALLAGAPGKPLNFSIEAAKTAFGQVGVKFTKSGDSLKGKSEDGVLSVTLVTSKNKLTTISGTINGESEQQVRAKIMPLIVVAGRFAPWASGWLISKQTELSQPGAIVQKSQDGVSIAFGATATGLTFSFKGE